MKLKVVRDDETPARSLGKLYADDVYICETCEDADRHIEDGGEKVYGETAIPRGLYKVVLSHSAHFNRTLPEILNVPRFSGVRIHGGNTAADSLGCILVGRVRMADGIANCAATVQRIIDMIESAEEHGEMVTLEVI
jgi:hypothetical protein